MGAGGSNKLSVHLSFKSMSDMLFSINGAQSLLAWLTAVKTNAMRQMGWCWSDGRSGLSLALTMRSSFEQVGNLYQ